MNAIYLNSSKKLGDANQNKAAKPVISRKDYLFYSFPLPPIDPTGYKNYLYLRLRNLYPGDIDSTGWYFYVQKKSLFAVVLNSSRFALLKKEKLLEKALLPPGCMKKYPWSGKFDMLIEYPDCYELISIDSNRITDSHVFALPGDGIKGTDNHRIEERLCSAIRKFACSEKIILCLNNPLPGIKKDISDNYNDIEEISVNELFNQPSSRYYRLESNPVQSFPVPRSIRMVFYMLAALFFSYLVLDQYQMTKEEILFRQNNRIRYLETLKAATDQKMEIIQGKQAELELIREREGTNIYSLLSSLALQMKGATIRAITVSGRDYELTGLHDNPLILVDTINKQKRLGTMRLRSSVPDPESGKQFFTISGSLK